METVAPGVDDQGLWEHRSRGLVVFADRRGLRCFRLPIAVEELVRSTVIRGWRMRS